jgi:hypothetical protein
VFAKKEGNSMKKHLYRIALCVLACSGSLALAQDYVVNTFNANINGVFNWRGNGLQTYSWSSNDAHNNPSSGSLQVVAPFNGPGDQFVCTCPLQAAQDISGYSALEFDLYWDTNSPTRNDGSYAYFEIGLKNTDSSQQWLPAYNVPATNGGNWVHVSIPMSASGQVDGVCFKMNGGNWGNPTSGTVGFWVDDIKLIKSTTLVLKTFDTGESVTSDPAVFNWWGNGLQTYSWSSNDANNNPSSGSLQVVAPFNGSGDQFVCTIPVAQQVLPSYTNLEFDLYWDTSSPTRNDGSYAYLEIGLKNTDWSQDWLPAYNVPASNGGNWVHVVVPIALSINNAIDGIIFKMNGGNWSNPTSGTVGFWVDNIMLTGPIQALPPSMTVQKAIPGLRIWASQANNSVQRDEVRTVNNDHTWYNSSPRTYSMTLASFPEQSHTNFQAHMFLIPLSAMPSGEGPDNAWEDYHATNIVEVQINNTGDGRATGMFMVKTNAPGSDGNMRTTGTLAIITNSTALGTWSVTFNNNTDVRLTSPSGAYTNFTVPAGAAALFGGGLCVYFGIDPNADADAGQSATFTHLQITGGDPINDTFSGAALDTNTWAVTSMDQVGTAFVPPTGVFWLSWSLPAGTWFLQASPDLRNPSDWYYARQNPGQLVPLTLPSPISRNVVLVTTNDLPSRAKGFFRLINQ